MIDRVEELLDEVRLVYNQIVRVAEQLHAHQTVTLGMRAVLEFVQKNGPSTVPQIARRRMVSRQHIQVLVNALLEQRLVTLEENPRHKRSALVTLTPAGEATFNQMRGREHAVYESADFSLNETELAAAADTLRRLRRGLTDVR